MDLQLRDTTAPTVGPHRATTPTPPQLHLQDGAPSPVILPGASSLSLLFLGCPATDLEACRRRDTSLSSPRPTTCHPALTLPSSCSPTRTSSPMKPGTGCTFVCGPFSMNIVRARLSLTIYLAMSQIFSPLLEIPPSH